MLSRRKMEKIFFKKLTVTERKRHWVLIPDPRYNRKFFPASHEDFNIIINNSVETSYIDGHNRLMLGSRIFNKHDLDDNDTYISMYVDDDKIILSKNSELS